MSTKRDSIIADIVTRLSDISLGLVTVKEMLQMVDIEQEAFTSFPMAHILDLDETARYLPGGVIESHLAPKLRFFFDAAITPADCRTFIGKLKLKFQSINVVGITDWMYLRDSQILASPSHKFAEIRVGLDIQYRYKKDAP